MSLLIIYSIIFNFILAERCSEDNPLYNYHQLINTFSFDNNINKPKIKNFYLSNDAKLINNTIFQLTKNNTNSKGSIINKEKFNTTRFLFQTTISLNPHNEKSSFFSIWFLIDNNYKELTFDTKITGFGIIMFVNFRYQYRAFYKLVFAENEKLIDSIKKEKIKHGNCLDHGINDRKIKFDINYDFETRNIFFSYDTPFQIRQMCMNYHQSDEKSNRMDFLENKEFQIGFFSSNLDNFNDLLLSKKNVTLEDTVFIYKQRLFNRNKDVKEKFAFKKEDLIKEEKVIENKKENVQFEEKEFKNEEKKDVNIFTLVVLFCVVVTISILFFRIKEKEKVN